MRTSTSSRPDPMNLHSAALKCGPSSFRISDLRWSLGFRIESSGFMVYGLRFMVYGLGFMA